MAHPLRTVASAGASVKEELKVIGVGIALATVGATLAGCEIKSHLSFGYDSVSGIGAAKVEDRKVGAFSHVVVGGGFQADIQVGPAQSVKVEVQENLLKLIKTTVEKGTLKIETTASISSDKPLLVHIKVPKLESLDVSGGATADVNGVKGNRFDLQCTGGARAKVKGSADEVSLRGSGGAQIQMSGVDSRTVTGSASGGASVTVAGKAKSGYLDASGGAQIDAKSLSLVDAEANGSGAAHIDVTVSGMLHAQANGATTITYAGGARVQATANGASTISKR
jgi:hypothetical protein